ncbi:cupin domain-containing protein [Streptomyces sp. NPDC059649]|uniref:cupin domain-containing protein n=1 Tax=Streptomyces sp. NPDC059649 TaxID=3346895 RepID=UPI00367DE7B9
MSESFYVLSGEIHVFDGERWFDASRGDYLYIPPGGVHSFGNISGEPAEFLVLFAPGAAREGYFTWPRGRRRIPGRTGRPSARRSRPAEVPPRARRAPPAERSSSRAPRSEATDRASNPSLHGRE